MNRQSAGSAEVVSAVRSTAALFDMSDRGILEVSGSDRVRWLDGMISGDVEALEAGESGSGCYAALLTNRGAIVADLHVARLGELYLLESLRSEIGRIREALDRFIIADDVALVDRSDDGIVLGLEGPKAAPILQAAIGDATNLPASECWAEVVLGGCAVRVAAFGFSGEEAYQLRMAEADRAAVEGALDAAACDVLEGGSGLHRGDVASLEVLRVEAGIPALGAELDEDVLPPEARLERAISTSKGCYVGQEIVARLRARGQVNHLLVGLRLASEAGGVAVGDELRADNRATGEITSLADSPSQGAIALGYVRREHAEPGTKLSLEAGSAVVAELPFVALGGRVPSEGHADGTAA